MYMYTTDSLDCMSDIVDQKYFSQIVPKLIRVGFLDPNNKSPFFFILFYTYSTYCYNREMSANLEFKITQT